jgi:predicted phage terminase large subunit-like protein
LTDSKPNWRRILPQIDLISFTEALGYVNAPFHEEIYTALQDESIKRLVLILPPGHGKSTCVTVNYPLWKVGRDHNQRFITASHTKDFVASFIREITQRLESEDYRRIFGELKPQRPNKWTQNELIVSREKIHKDPTFTALGTGQAIIGRRAHEIILDDIIDEDYASSEVLRESVWSWYKNEVLTRLEPDGRVVVVGTRVYFADFYGRLLEEKDETGKPLWHVILLPAIDEHNQALWPAKWPLELLLQKKQELGSPVFSRKYLGQPTPQEGAELLAKWLNYYHPLEEDIPNRVYKLPPRERLRVVQAWDLAISESPTAAYTVGLTLGSDMEGGLYVLHYVREHWDYPTTSKMIEAQALAWKPEKIGIESVQYQRMVAQGLRPKLLPIVDIKQSKAKDERVRSISPHFENGRIRIDRGMDELIMEYLQFPKGTKDILDALEMAIRLLIEQAPQFGLHTAVRK